MNYVKNTFFALALIVLSAPVVYGNSEASVSPATVAPASAPATAAPATAATAPSFRERVAQRANALRQKLTVDNAKALYNGNRRVFNGLALTAVSGVLLKIAYNKSATVKKAVDSVINASKSVLNKFKSSRKAKIGITVAVLGVLGVLAYKKYKPSNASTSASTLPVANPVASSNGSSASGLELVSMGTAPLSTVATLSPVNAPVVNPAVTVEPVVNA